MSNIVLSTLYLCVHAHTHTHTHFINSTVTLIIYLFLVIHWLIETVDNGEDLCVRCTKIMKSVADKH